MSVTDVETAGKVTAGHLARTAYLYVRQSTLRQVVHNTESATRQYALRQRAIALGWPAEQIVTIDCDQGQSGASAADREGFQRLVAEVGIGRAGIVLGLEVSRLARNNADSNWAKCASEPRSAECEADQVCEASWTLKRSCGVPELGPSRVWRCRARTVADEDAHCWPVAAGR
jgi:hypothetical protein